jgi:hypothetical protein
MNRYSSRLCKLNEQFLNAKLSGAVSYDRIAGYFCSSVLEVAGEAIEAVMGKVRVICNSGLAPSDVAVARLGQRVEWNGFKPEEVYAAPGAMARLAKLYGLLRSGKLEVRVLPDKIYGLMHGKAGVLTYADGRKTSFLGSINETMAAFTANYEMVWEDSDAASVEWVQAEFDFFWNSPHAVALSDYVIEDIKRISGRRRIPLQEWRAYAEEPIPAVAAEEPIYREQFGLWAHQKYFIARVWDEHKQRGGARLLLADQVGLGKTVQLAMAAKLIALCDEKPILVIVPKTLVFQWQEELLSLLNLPSAVWTGRYWVDENGYEYPADSTKAILKCPRRVGIISQGLITRKSESAELLLNLRYSCVILDEAHRARRKPGKDPDTYKAQPNNLLAFIEKISMKTTSLLLATATPVQIDPIEAFDLLRALSLPQDADKVLGDEYSVWRRTPKLCLKYIQGEEPYPDAEAEIWELIRNPFPPGKDDKSFEILRQQLNIADDEYVLEQKLYGGMSKPLKNRIRILHHDDNFIQNHNPYIRAIVRRTRDFLENTVNAETGEPYLKKITAVLFGENDDEALELSGYLAQAYTIAEEFCDMLSSRVQGGGFMSTLLLRRIGSTMTAGENTAKKMLAWTCGGKEKLRSLYDEIADDNDDEDDEEAAQSGIKELTAEEIDCLERLVNVLKSNTDADPKYNRIRSILSNGVESEGAWKDKGCILFSQYYDSAVYIVERLSKDFPDISVALYAGGDKSGIYKNGLFRKTSKDEIKRCVRIREIMILVGTDAASEGLNLQALGALINIDLPWNPTRLEQRKGRIQRIGQLADSIYIFNMRYKDSVEDRVHSKLSGRLQEIFALFGQIPDVLRDVWVDIAQRNIESAELAINSLPQRNPFVLKYEESIPDCGDWEKCAIVLDKEEEARELLRSW